MERELLRLSVLRLITERPLEAGELVLLRRLEQRWVRSGLRRNDLLSGVLTLAASHHLDLIEHETDTYLSLTDSGVEAARTAAADSPGDWAQFVEQRLPAVRRRPPRQGSEQRDRAGDRPAPTAAAPDRLRRSRRP
ncbi:MAG TPA: hypothetical protein VFV27_06185 [Nevskiaceae bacterium]|nr:hypothetical protein [Nevskiaceae bacterium]